MLIDQRGCAGNRPADNVPQRLVGVPTKIAIKTCVASELQKLLLDDVDGAQVVCRNDSRPKISQPISNRQRGIEEHARKLGRLRKQVNGARNGEWSTHSALPRRRP
jgi:hypothetical protein